MSEAEIKPQVIESPEIKQLQQYEVLRQVLLIVSGSNGFPSVIL